MFTRTVRWPSLGLLVLLLGALVLGSPPGTFALTNGQAAGLVLGHTSFTTDGFTTARRMHGPMSLALDPTSGVLFVADQRNHRVLRFPSSAAFIDGIAADGVFGQQDFTGSTPGIGAQQMHYPWGVDVDSSGRLWVADRYNNRVLRFDAAASKPSGSPADAVLGQLGFTSNGSAASQQGMYHPFGVEVDASGRLWVADGWNNRVLRFDAAVNKPNGAPADGVLGQPNFTSAAIATTAQGMHAPLDIVADGSGHLWISDRHNNRVLRFDNAASKPNGAPADGVLGQPNFTSRSTATTAQGMDGPLGLVIDAGGRLWVVEGGNHRVLRFDNATGKPNGAAADGVLGQPNFTSKVSPFTAQGMYGPYGVEVDASGRLWVADSGFNRVLRFEVAASKPNGAPANGVLGQFSMASMWYASATALHYPSAVAVDHTTGKVFVADHYNARVLRFASRTSLSNGSAAEAVLGQPDLISGASGGGVRGMGYPAALAVDQSGRLWVADEGNNRVLRFDAASSKPSGAAADGVLGQPDFTSVSPATTAQGMDHPWGLAVDSSGRLWVADRNNHRVLRFDAAAGKPIGASADSVLGQPNFTSRGAGTGAQSLRDPRGLAVDAGGRLWVADSQNNRVLRFDAAAGKPNSAPADGALGQATLTSNTAATSAQGMRSPYSVAVDPGGQLWVADRDNHRVLWFGAAASKPNGAPADGVFGQPNFTSNTAATSAKGMRSPYGVGTDSLGRLWVADRDNHRMLLFEEPTRLRLPDQGGWPGRIVRVPVFVDLPLSGLIAASLSVSFDPAVLRPHGDAVYPGTLTPDWMAIANPGTPGLLQLDLISAGAPASGIGTLAELQFEVVGSVGSSTPLVLNAVSLNDGDIPATTQAGTFRVEAASYRLDLRAVHATTGLGLPGTAVQVSGPASASCLTGSAGGCALPVLPAGSYTLALTKADEAGGITSYDASLILQHTSGQRVLTGPAFTAADTNGNGQVTSLDAALVLQYTSGQRTLPFPAGVVWKFASPSPLVLDQDRAVAVPGVLIGDVSGHLPPALLTAGAAEGAGALQLVQRGAPDAQGFRTVELWLSPDGGPLHSLEASLAFDPALVRDLQVLSGPSTGALFAANTASDGKLRLALASAGPLPGGTVLTLRYRADGVDGLRLVEARTNQSGQPAWLPPITQDWQLRAPLVQR